MKRMLTLLLAGASFLSTTAQSNLYDFKIQKVKEGIYFAYRPEPLRKFVEGNVTIIITDIDVILVDAGGSTTSAKNIMAEVKKLTNKPIRYIINTHPHADHTLGNEAFVKSNPGLEVISSTWTRNDIIERTPEYIKLFTGDLTQLRKEEYELAEQVEKEHKPGYEAVVAYVKRYPDEDIFVRSREYSKLTISPATLLVDDELTFKRSNRTIVIKHIGHGDTPGDLIVYLPEDKVVCSGDMVVHPVPYGFSSKPLEWINTLDKLSSLDFDVLIPGHGEIRRNGKEYVADISSLLKSLHEQVKAGIAKGQTQEQIQETLDLHVFTDKYLNNDPVAFFRFKRWFSGPATGQAFKIYSGR